MNLNDRRVNVTTFEDTIEANEYYKQKELQSLVNPDIDVVMVSVSKHNQLKKAYPNYFVDSRKFLALLSRIERLAKYSINTNQLN